MDDTLITAIAMVRDVAFISLLLVAAMVGLLLYRKLSSFLGSARQTIEIINELVATLSDKFGKPPAERRGLASRIGRLASLIARRKRRR